MRRSAAGSAVAPVGVEDARELALDLGHGQPSDVEALQARHDRRRELLRMCGREHEDDELGRLLERLQEGVPGVLRDLVRLIEDVDLARRSLGGIVDPLAQLADGVDPAVPGGIDLDEVNRPALADRVAGPHASHGSPSRRSVQLSALARIRASDVLPVPRGPTNSIACDTRSVRTAFAASRRPPPGRRSGRTSARASGGRGPGAGWSAVARQGHDAPGRRARTMSCRAPSVDLDVPAPTTTSGSDQAVPRHPARIA